MGPASALYQELVQVKHRLARAQEGLDSLHFLTLLAPSERQLAC